MSMGNIKEHIEYRRWAKYGKLLSGLIHNLNTPLMGVSGRLELLQFKHPDLKGLDQMMKQLDVINTMLSKISQVIDKDKYPGKEMFNIGELLEAVDALLRTEMRYKHKTEVIKEWDDSINLEINGSALQTAIYEIIMNSLEAFSDAGELRIGVVEEGGVVKLYIENNGPEITDDVLDKIFTAGFSTKDQLGLGLNIVAECVNEIGGNLDITSNEEKTRFEISFVV